MSSFYKQMTSKAHEDISNDLISNPQSDIASELFSRLQQEIPYTSLGPRVMIALNSEYSRTKSTEALSKSYALSLKNFQPVAPHLYQLPGLAYLHMTVDKQDQSIILR
jgi:myosin heavy subunit